MNKAELSSVISVVRPFEKLDITLQKGVYAAVFGPQLETKAEYRYLKIIGANSTFEIVKKANDEFPNGIVPSDRGERYNILLEIEEKADPTWAECNKVFYQYPNNISALLVEFIKNNRNDFV